MKAQDAKPGDRIRTFAGCGPLTIREAIENGYRAISEQGYPFDLALNDEVYILKPVDNQMRLELEER